jgi:hypothetical protein
MTSYYIIKPISNLILEEFTVELDSISGFFLFLGSFISITCSIFFEPNAYSNPRVKSELPTLKVAPPWFLFQAPGL